MHLHEIAKEVADQWFASPRIKQGHGEPTYIEQIIKNHPLFEIFRDQEVSVNLEFMREIISEAEHMEPVYMRRTFEQMARNASMDDVRRLLEETGWDENTNRMAMASAMLVETGRTRLGLEVLRQAMQELRMDERGNVKGLEEEAQSGPEGEEEYTVREDLIEHVFIPFLEENPTQITRHLQQLRLTPLEWELLGEACQDMYDRADRDLVLATDAMDASVPRNVTLGMPRERGQYPAPANLNAASQWHSYQEALARQKNLSVLLAQIQRLSHHRH